MMSLTAAKVHGHVAGAFARLATPEAKPVPKPISLSKFVGINTQCPYY